MKLFYLFLPVIVGVALTAQASINGQLRVAINNPLMATLISFLVGTILLVAILLLSSQRIPSIPELTNIEWYKYTGGILGAFIVMAIIISIQNINPSAMFALIVTGQLLTALAFEQFGLLGVKPSPISWPKIVGVILLVVSVYLINKKK